mmetsp:Transcript_82974/g.199096  ORF Transcript_82974/g.199096 Transcript_82974/m.199096 type:complete len:638 (+) Transcript_82974:2-1915(+)
MFGANTGGGLFGANAGGGMFGQNTGGGMFGQNTGGGLFGQNTGGGLFGQSPAGGGLFGQNTGGGLFGGNTGGGLFGAKPSGGGLFGASSGGGGLFGGNSGGGLFGGNTGGGLFGNTGGGMFGGNTGGGLFGQNTGGGMFGQNTGGGMFGQNTGGGLFGGNAGGGLFGNSGGGGGLFGQSSGGGLFGANTGGGLFGNSGGMFGGQNTGGGLFGNSGGGLFGAKSSGGGLFGGSSAGGLFGGNTGGLFGNSGGGLFGGGGGLFGNSGGLGASSGGLFGATAGGLFGASPAVGMPGMAGLGGMMSPSDPYGLGGLVTANHAPPRPLGLTVPKTPSHANSAYLWKSQPDASTKARPSTPSRCTSEGSVAERSPRSASFSLPPSAMTDHIRSYGSSTPRSRPATPTSGPDVSPSAFLRVSMKPKSPKSPVPISPRRTLDEGLPPLRRPWDAQVDGTTGGTGTPTAAVEEVATPTLKPIKPNIVRHGPDRSGDEAPATEVAAASLVPKLTRADYYSNPSVEAMSRMSETQLSRVDNLEIGRYGFGSVKWPGLTDVRCHDFDRDVRIERGSLTLYPDREKPDVGQGLNKEAVVTLHVKPTRSDAKPKSLEQLQSRLSKLSEDFGGKFISYDMERWIFRVPHFNG